MGKTFKMTGSNRDMQFGFRYKDGQYENIFNKNKKKDLKRK